MDSEGSKAGGDGSARPSAHAGRPTISQDVLYTTFGFTTRTSEVFRGLRERVRFECGWWGLMVGWSLVRVLQDTCEPHMYMKPNAFIL